MFQDLKWTSPLYTVDGIGTFLFRCRYPNDDDILIFYSAHSRISEKFSAGDTPISKPLDEAQSLARTKAFAKLYADSALTVIEDVEATLLNGHRLDNWRDEFGRDGRPAFVGSMLRAIGRHLFREPTESGPETSPVAD